MSKKTIIYKTPTGIEAYTEYVDSLKDRLGAAKIRVRVTRAELGNFGDHKNIGHGIIELRIDYGPGYRVYVGLHGKELIVLLCAGAKSTQIKDVKTAMEYWDDYKEFMKNYRTHDDYLNKALKDPKEAALYMNAAVEEKDPVLMLAVLAQIVRAHGVSKMAKKVSLSRTGIYKTLSKKGNPELKTFLGILDASGLKMSFKPAHLHHV